MTLAQLSDHDLLKILTGTRRDRCAEFHDAYQAEALSALAAYDLGELQHALQLTPAATKRLGAALELHRRLLRGKPSRPSLRDPEAVAQLMRPLAGGDHECLWCLCLDTRCQLIGEPVQISQGDIDGCEAGPRLVFRNALRRGACSVIVVHNHPSGSPEPSTDDIAITERLRKAGRMVDIDLADHLIICADGSYVSLRRNRPGIWA